MLFLHLLLLGNYLVLVSCSFVFVVLHCGEYWCKWQVPIWSDISLALVSVDSHGHDWWWLLSLQEFHATFWLSFFLGLWLQPPPPPPTSYGGSRARGRIRPTTAGAYATVTSTIISKLRLQPTPQRKVMPPDPKPTVEGLGSNLQPHGSWLDSFPLFHDGNSWALAFDRWRDTAFWNGGARARHRNIRWMWACAYSFLVCWEDKVALASWDFISPQTIRLLRYQAGKRESQSSHCGSVVNESD